jgi:hypothetical protein
MPISLLPFVLCIDRETRALLSNSDPKPQLHTYALRSFIPDADVDKYLLAWGSMTPEMSERKKSEKRRELREAVEMIWLRKTNVVTSPLADRLVERVDTKMLAPHLPSVNV